MRDINRVAVLGKTLLAEEIAIHLANCGVRTLLDSARSISDIVKSTSHGFHLPEIADNVRIIDFSTDSMAIGECDWVIEAADDDLTAKQKLLREIDNSRHARALVSTTTSQLSLHVLREGLSEDFCNNFFASHFLQPIHQRKLIEIVPCSSSSDASIRSVVDFCQDVLGKGVVVAKDTPGFIADRVSSFADSHLWNTLEAVDVRDVVYRGDEASELIWQSLSQVLLNTALIVDQISDDITQVDDALRWGKDWTLGPFQLWDAIGVVRTVERLEQESRPIPPIIEKFLSSGGKTFYRRSSGREYFFDFVSGEYHLVKLRPGVTKLRQVQAINGVVSKNPGATILDLGDGIECLEFHSSENAITDDVVLMINYVIDLLDNGEFEALVIGNQGRQFCSGIDYARLAKDIESGKWDDIRRRFEGLQKLCLRIKYASKPIVVALFNETMGAGCSMVLHANHVSAAIETTIGFDEFTLGLIPLAGGSKELHLRSLERSPDPLAALQSAFKAIVTPLISRNALEAKKYGFLPQTARITMDRDRLIEYARLMALGLISEKSSNDHNHKYVGDSIPVLGESAYLEIERDISGAKGKEQIGKHDAMVMQKVARVLTGGDLKHPTKVSEQHLLNLELEALMSLCGESETIKRLNSFEFRLQAASSNIR